MRCLLSFWPPLDEHRSRISSPGLGVGLAVTLALFLAAAASSPAAADPSAPRADVTHSIGYQGVVTDAQGNPIEGSVDLVFQLWSEAAAGYQLGTDIARPGVEVAQGVFSTQIDLPPLGFDGRALWLRVQVDGEWLQPRQPLLAAPYALTLVPGAFVKGDQEPPVLDLMNETGPALRARGIITGALGMGQTGLSGLGDVGVRGEGLVGVRGVAGMGTGVEGEGDTAGVAGKSVGGPGVLGESQLGDGVLGTSQGGFSAGVAGRGATGVFGLGALTGVSGFSPAENGLGVMGAVTATGGTGVRGEATFGTGVTGQGETGVIGEGSVGAGVEGTGTVGVSGFGTGIAGVLGSSSGGTDSAGVSGENTGLGYGGRFTSADAVGMYAEGAEGVHGKDTSGTLPGVHGESQTVGVLGESEAGQGVRGQSATNDGVVGRTNTTIKSGVFGVNIGQGPGVTARSDGGNSLHVPSAGGHALYIHDATVHGVHVRHAYANGVDVASAGQNGVQVYAATKSAVYVNSSGEDGIRVRTAGWNGVAVDSASYAGVYVSSAGGDGIRIQTATKDGLRMFEGIGRDYIFAGSDADPDFRVANDGLVLSDRGFRCGDGAPGCLQSGGADVAEKVDSAEELAPGDVVEIDPTAPDRFRLARSARSRLVAGVISSAPAVILGTQGSDVADTTTEDLRPALALVGRVPVKVSAENGPIAIGDLLVSASTPGHAMRDGDPAPGTVIGKALEALPSGTGTILVLVQSH
jgi:hypothetical protein